MIFSTELFGTYKPCVYSLSFIKNVASLWSIISNPKAYLEAARHLSLPPEKCAMVAAHIYDLRYAAQQGMKTVYVRRGKEDGDFTRTVKSKEEGGEVDVVVSSFIELAKIRGV